MTEYLISDTHFNHKKIIDFEEGGRSFATVEDMNEEIINQWNSIVTNNDTVYHLGDISMNGKYNELAALFERLKGKKIIIQGNHDNTSDLKKLKRDNYIEDYHEFGIRLKRQKQLLYLSHYPTSLGRRPNMWSVHGHIHSQPSNEVNQINVGVDSPFMNNVMNIPFGQPISLDKVVGYMISNPIEPYPRREE